MSKVINIKTKITIEKLNYSSLPWRLMVDGEELWAPFLFDHPTLGKMYIDDPVAGNTKKECVERALELLGQLLDERREKHVETVD